MFEYNDNSLESFCKLPKEVLIAGCQFCLIPSHCFTNLYKFFDLFEKTVTSEEKTEMVGDGFVLADYGKYCIFVTFA